MSKDKNKFNQAEDPEVVNPENVEISDDFAAEEGDAVAEESAEPVEEKSEVEQLREDLAKEKKEYLFLMAEFDNFRKRTLKEKSEIIRNAGENVLKGLLPIVDDFERGLKAAANAENVQVVDEGMQLIYNKLVKYLNANGVKEFDPADDVYDADKHEAISVVPVPDEDKKGKILDTVEKGYMINDKVLRHAKVVVGQ
ncbi:MAG: nucleotide exchange factor GrpE [Bacteroides sp.]|nr:nucleotide exchange factor GrpE [Bacteroidales bacterium]MBD5296039.1 nucleotide exchange factor GrpE [Bacteroides sp.]MDE6234450.1 nucleotide exchange factor GrpE [Muribaculaceae bacterium]